MLRYLYTDKVEVTDDSMAISLLYAAKKYLIENLALVCRTYLEGNINNSNACFIYGKSQYLDEKEINNLALNQIEQNAYEVLPKGGLTSVSKDSLAQLVRNDKLFIAEADVLRAVLLWAESECCHNDLEVNGENMRSVLGDIIYDIRFPLMSSRDIAKIFQPTGIFTESEMCDLFMRNLSKDYTSKGKLFNAKERNGSVRKIVKIGIKNELPIQFEKYTTAVKINVPIRLVGVLIAPVIPKDKTGSKPTIDIEVTSKSHSLFKEKNVTWELFSGDLWLVKLANVLEIRNYVFYIHVTYGQGEVSENESPSVAQPAAAGFAFNVRSGFGTPSMPGSGFNFPSTGSPLFQQTTSNTYGFNIGQKSCNADDDKKDKQLSVITIEGAVRYIILNSTK